MKRAIGAFGFTVVGLWLVLTFRSSPVKSAVVAAPTPTRASASTQPESSVAPVATAPPAERTFDGSAVWTQYGTVQVAITTRGRQITNVTTLQMPFEHPRSAYISQTVAPWLKDEVLKAQSANIDTISGATFTSEAYAQSLQAALNKANA